MGQYSFQAKDDKTINYYHWTPEAPKAILQIAHGMGEHAGRYAGLAEELGMHGYAVFANDHRGHGHTASSAEDVGYFDHGGHFWEDTQNDLMMMTAIARKDHPGIPLFMMGHSMGSFLTRDYITNSSLQLQGAILSGTAGDPGSLARVGRWLSGLISMIFGRGNRSEFLRRISFGKYAASVKPMRTPADWLSREEAVVNAYIDDPRCGLTFTSGFWMDLLDGIQRINKSSTYVNTPPELPMYLFAGESDPVGDYGKGVKDVYDLYKKVGVKDLTLKLYPGARHETLNETNRDEVVADLIDWLDQHV